MSLTNRQFETLVALRRYIAANAESPTYRELAVDLGVSVPTVFQVVQAMKRKGVIDFADGSSRSIRIVGESPATKGMLDTMNEAAAVVRSAGKEALAVRLERYAAAQAAGGGR